MLNMILARPVRLPSLAGAVRRLPVRLMEICRIIEGRRAIAQMDARMLSDIGLSKADAKEEVRRKPWDTRPAPR